MTILSQDELKRVLSTPHGRLIMWEIMGIGGVLKQPFAGADSAQTAFACGSLNVGIVIWSECMEASPDLTAMMIKEQGNGRPSDDTPNGDSTSGNNTSKRKRNSAGRDDSGDPLHLGFDRSGWDGGTSE